MVNKRADTIALKKDGEQQLKASGDQLAQSKKKVARLQVENKYLSGRELQPSDVIIDEPND